MSRHAFETASELRDRGNYRNAFRVFLHAAQRGDRSVYINLGFAYDVGQGIRRCRSKALYWYRRALAGGDEGSAAHNIGTIYRERRDILRAMRWFRRAVAIGNSGSNLELGQLLLGGGGQPVEALACFRAVGPQESDAAIEASRTWVAVAEGMLAHGGEPKRV
jgi:TPR repeat protein